MTTTARTGLQLRSTVKKEGLLELSLVDVPIPEPKPDEVVVRVEASPINPSDLGLLLGGADMSTAKASGTPERPVVTAEIRPEILRGMAGRIDQPDYEFNPDDMAEGQHLVAWIPCEQCGRRAKLHMKRETKPAN